jgi:uncharacterized protein (TIGR00266 family)
MRFEITDGPVFTRLVVSLDAGEAFKAEAGAMVSMSPSIELESKGTGKGVFGSIKAAVGGESLFASIFKAQQGAGEVVLAPGTPGDIKQFSLNNQTILAQSGAYLAGSVDLDLSTQGSLKALISGEGLFLSKISGTGDVFINSFGSIYEKELADGETYIVDTGHIVAFESQVTYTLKKAAKSLISSFTSGEGLVAEYKGPGKLWVQTRNLSAFAGMLAPFLTKR